MLYQINENAVCNAHNYLTVALRNLGYTTENILKISAELDRLFEHEKPKAIEVKADKIMKKIFG